MLYIKLINGRDVISQCKTIKTDYGWISNPTVEQILAEGWVEYQEPEIQYAPQDEPDTLQILEAVKQMLNTQASQLTDEEALSVAALYPTWTSKIGLNVQVGERLWYDGKLYKVIQSHTIQDDWTPNTSASLFTEISIEEFPEWIQPTGAHDAYNTGDKVSHNGTHWICTSDANVYEPGVYGWDQL